MRLRRRDVGSHTFSQIARVACVEVVVLQASEDVDVVHVEVSDSGKAVAGCFGGPENPRFARGHGPLPKGEAP